MSGGEAGLSMPLGHFIHPLCSHSGAHSGSLAHSRDQGKGHAGAGPLGARIVEPWQSELQSVLCDGWDVLVVVELAVV